jgi:hypothetical protein
MDRIEVRQLIIRLRHVDPQTAQQAVEGLGREVLHALASQDSRRSGGVLQIQQMELGVLSGPPDGSAAGLRNQMSQAVSGAIQAKRTQGKGD